jgi:hypothetical protein
VTASVHVRYAMRLAALGADEVVVPAATRAAERLGLGDCDQALERDYARFHPHREPFATLVLRDASGPVLRVEAFGSRRAGTAMEATPAGWLWVSAFASDPALPSLPRLLATPGRQAVVRYRPYRRCTVRFDGGYAKAFADRRGRRLVHEGGRLWAAAERGELAFAVPRPEWYDPTDRTLWQSRVRGRPVGSVRLDSEAARRMGYCLASLATADLKPQTVLTAKAAVGRSARLASCLVRSVPGTKPDVRELLARLRRAHAASAPARRLAPVHGNPHPGQWLDGAAGLGLVDFDGLALGEPELDVAAVLTALECEDPERVPIQELCEAFLGGYRERGPALSAALLAIHRAHRRLAKAARVAASLRPDGDARAARHVNRALRELEAA